MSLTSYRAAPPRVIEIFKLADNWPGWPPLCRASFGRRFASPGLTEDLPGRASREWLLDPALNLYGPPRDRFGGTKRAGRPGSDLLFRALRRSTIGAEGFHGRVRDGIGCFAPRYGHQAGQTAPECSGPRLGEKRVVMCVRCVFGEN